LFANNQDDAHSAADKLRWEQYAKDQKDAAITAAKEAAETADGERSAADKLLWEQYSKDQKDAAIAAAKEAAETARGELRTDIDNVQGLKDTQDMTDAVGVGGAITNAVGKKEGDGLGKAIFLDTKGTIAKESKGDYIVDGVNQHGAIYAGLQTNQEFANTQDVAQSAADKLLWEAETADGLKDANDYTNKNAPTKAELKVVETTAGNAATKTELTAVKTTADAAATSDALTSALTIANAANTLGLAAATKGELSAVETTAGLAATKIELTAVETVADAAATSDALTSVLTTANAAKALGLAAVTQGELTAAKDAAILAAGTHADVKDTAIALNTYYRTHNPIFPSIQSNAGNVPSISKCFDWPHKTTCGTTYKGDSTTCPSSVSYQNCCCT